MNQSQSIRLPEVLNAQRASFAHRRLGNTTLARTG